MICDVVDCLVWFNSEEMEKVLEVIKEIWLNLWIKWLKIIVMDVVDIYKSKLSVEFIKFII